MRSSLNRNICKHAALRLSQPLFNNTTIGDAVTRTVMFSS